MQVLISLIFGAAKNRNHGVKVWDFISKKMARKPIQKYFFIICFLMNYLGLETFVALFAKMLLKIFSHFLTSSYVPDIFCFVSVDNTNVKFDTSCDLLVRQGHHNRQIAWPHYGGINIKCLSKTQQSIAQFRN